MGELGTIDLNPKGRGDGTVGQTPLQCGTRPGTIGPHCPARRHDWPIISGTIGLIICGTIGLIVGGTIGLIIGGTIGLSARLAFVLGRHGWPGGAICLFSFWAARMACAARMASGVLDRLLV
jgi:hypothetical protein